MKYLLALFALMLSTQTFANTFTLTSQSIHAQKSIPTTYTCHGSDMSPDLSWTGIPANTKSLVLILSDPDAPSGIFYHWIMYNIPPTERLLPENLRQLPNGAILGKNSFGNVQYNGPCPPKNTHHHYIFTLYALDNIIDIPKDSDADAVLSALPQHLLGQTQLSAIYP